MDFRRASRVAEPVVRDLRLAFRALSRKPGIGALAIASISLAIGFSTAAFSVLDAYEFRDIPLRDPRSLARIWAQTREQRLDDLSWIEYQALVSRSRSFTDILVEDRQGPRVRLPDRDDFPITAGVSDNYFDLLGIRAGRGDVFHAGHGRDGTVVITDHYWRSGLGSDPAVVGRVLPVGRAMLRIVGVLSPGVGGPYRGLVVDLFVPHETFFGSLQYAGPNDLRYADFEPLGRLRPGVSLEAAQAEVDTILRQVEAEGLAPAPGRKSSVEPFVKSNLAADAVLLAVVGLLMLIAGANLANLRLVENEARRTEIAIRLALGAGRRQLARQQVAETAVLGGFGLIAGLMLARWLIGLAPALFYGSEKFIDYGVRMDLRTFAFACAALVPVALAGALVPLADGWKRSFAPALGGVRAPRASRWLGGLVVAQMALATGGAATAGLLIRTLQNVSAIRPAMDTDRAVVLVQGFWERAKDRAAQAAAMAGQIGAMPGVTGVTWARRAMLSGSGGGATIDVEMPNQPKYSFFYNQVSPSYFAVTGARILSGRGFGAGDGPDATRVVMVNAAFVRRFLAGRNPIGQWVKVDGRDHQIIGVVEDGPTNDLHEKIQPYLYFAYAQRPPSDATFFIASRRDPAALVQALRPLARRADFILLDCQSLSQFLHNARMHEEMGAEVTGSLALTALLLAAAGLFGVTLFAVARRAREFGVRVAMGARPVDLALQVLRQAGVRVALAFLPGWALAYAARGALKGELYGVAPDDPSTLLVASAVVAGVAILAALYPALRAAHSDAMTALRQE